MLKSFEKRFTACYQSRASDEATADAVLADNTNAMVLDLRTYARYRMTLL